MRHVAALSLVTLMLLASCTEDDGGIAPDSWEPNDDAASAVFLGDTWGVHHISATINHAGDEDWYQVDVPSGGQFVLDLGMLKVDLDLLLIGEDGVTELARSDRSGAQAEALDFTAPYTGTYYVVVKSAAGDYSRFDYGLRVELNPDAREINDSLESAWPLGSGENVYDLSGYVFPTGDEDWYSFNVPAAGNIIVDLTGLPDDFDVELRNSSGEALTWSEALGTAPEHFVFASDVGGTYYVVVYAPDSVQNSATPYNLQIQVATGDPFEPNDTLSEACHLGDGGTSYSVEALIDDDGSVLVADEDWFYVVAEEGDNILVDLQDVPADYDVELLNVAGTALTWSDNSGQADESISWLAETSGVYYVRVYPFSGFSDTEPYRLSVVVTSRDVFEPNDSLNDAWLIGGGTDVVNQAVTYSLSARLEEWGAEDWYAIPVPMDGNVYVHLGNLDADYDLFLYDAAQSLVASSENADFLEEVLAAGSFSGETFYLRVVGYDGVYSNTPYHLTVTVSPFDVYEPNDTNTSAFLLGYEGRHQVVAMLEGALEDDWYAVDGNAGDWLSIALDSLPYDYDIQVYRFTAEGDPVLIVESTNAGTAPENIGISLTATDLYFLRVYSGTGGSSPSLPYHLTVDLQ